MRKRNCPRSLRSQTNSGFDNDIGGMYILVTSNFTRAVAPFRLTNNETHFDAIRAKTEKLK